MTMMRDAGTKIRSSASGIDDTKNRGEAAELHLTGLIRRASLCAGSLCLHRYILRELDMVTKKIKQKERRWGMWEQGTHTLMVTV